MVACHADDNPQNNHLSNLRWDTPGSNMLDLVRNGLHHNAVKECCIRGHVLAGRNLRLAPPTKASSQMRRSCVACQRAACRVRYWKARGIDLNLTAVADEYYAVIAKE
jgi:hypothetical protein